MIDIKKKILISALVLIITATGVAATSHVFAQNANSGPFSTLVQMIADKFNLNRNDVQAVFDQYRTDRQNAMQTRFEKMLNQLVQDGKITDAQKQLILNKWQELKANRQKDAANWKNMTPDQRKAARESQKQALSDWAKQNNIDLQYLYAGRMGHFGGMKGGWDMK